MMKANHNERRRAEGRGLINLLWLKARDDPTRVIQSLAPSLTTLPQKNSRIEEEKEEVEYQEVAFLSRLMNQQQSHLPDD